MKHHVFTLLHNGRSLMLALTHIVLPSAMIIIDASRGMQEPRQVKPIKPSNSSRLSVLRRLVAFDLIFGKAVLRTGPCVFPSTLLASRCRAASASSRAFSSFCWIVRGDSLRSGLFYYLSASWLCTAHEPEWNTCDR